jgi:predicted Zn-dependent protease with MMP-like domain
MRGPLAPAGVPLSRTRSEAFDALVLDAVDELEGHWAGELAAVEFAVEEVPPPGPADFGPDVIVDRGVPLGRLLREGAGLRQPLIVLYRRPIEARAAEPEDRSDLVFMVVAELVAELLGRDIEDLD